MARKKAQHAHVKEQEAEVEERLEDLQPLNYFQVPAGTTVYAAEQAEFVERFLENLAGCVAATEKPLAIGMGPRAWKAWASEPMQRAGRADGGPVRGLQNYRASADGPAIPCFQVPSFAGFVIVIGE